MKSYKLFCMAAALAPMLSFAQVHKEQTLRDGWTFSFNGGEFKEVVLPHDWAISGNFDKELDIKRRTENQGGKEVKIENTGETGSLPWIGKGEYRTTFKVPKHYTHAELLFDGAMAEPEVYVNGQKAGFWLYGYNAFRVDATPFLKEGGKANELVVKLKNVENSSRWYPGGGLYRPVKLILSGDDAIDTWGVCVTTPKVSKSEAEVNATVQLRKGSSSGLGAEFAILDDKGNVVAQSTGNFGTQGEAQTTMTLKLPRLWSPESPSLYTLRTTVKKDGKTVDENLTRFGVRSFSFTKENGFQFNGVTRKIKGVCLHHDLGPLGAALNKAALIRQIKILKDMGCDGIRTSHNMPSTMLSDLCDSLGMFVMAESFDCWKEQKNANGYNRFYDEWWAKDLTNLILNHRNHPSIIMWSIGNEIPEQNSKEGAERCRRMVELCHKLDPTRPVTAGMNSDMGVLRSGYAQALDIFGINYHIQKYEEIIDSIPQGFILGAETSSALSSRGVYKFPVRYQYLPQYPDLQVSSYDYECVSWGNIADDDAWMQDDKPWVVGEFVWTGFDYLGEPTPYNNSWPSRSSYFGIVDLAGMPKDRFYHYRSRWNKEDTTIHLLPHWTWPGREGQVTPVICYSNYDEAELFVNGKSQGRVKKDVTRRFGRYRLKWDNVKYEPGELKVVVYDKAGRVAGEEVVRTAGKPARIVLEADRTTLKADGDDIAFVTVKVVDANGVECPTADNQLNFKVSGAAKYQAACNGDPTSLEPFMKPTMKLFNGALVVLVRAEQKKGKATLTVTDAANKELSASLSLNIEK